MENRTNADWILTYTGKKFFPLAPRFEDIDIFDIAHALSNTCRFAGHCKNFYSVAQHSVLVAEKIWDKTFKPYLALAGLLHDASEAYLCDIARPVKHSAELESYRRAECKLQAVIDDKFCVTSVCDTVKTANEYLLKVEAYFLMPNHPDWSLTTEKPSDFLELVCWSPEVARHKFLNAFLEFGGNQEKKVDFQKSNAA